MYIVFGIAPAKFIFPSLIPTLWRRLPVLTRKDVSVNIRGPGILLFFA
jgi:hypothetical protein